MRLWTPPPPLPSPLPSTKAERQALRDVQAEYYLRSEFLGDARAKVRGMTSSVWCSQGEHGKCVEVLAGCLCEHHDIEGDQQ